MPRRFAASSVACNAFLSMPSGFQTAATSRSLDINFLEQLKPQPIRFVGDIGSETRNISTWPRKAGDQAVGDGLSRIRHHNRNRARGMHYGSDGSVWTNHDYVWPQRNKLSGYARQPFHPPFGKSVLECDVLALQISEPPQALDEGLVQMPNSISSRCRE